MAAGRKSLNQTTGSGPIPTNVFFLFLSFQKNNYSYFEYLSICLSHFPVVQNKAVFFN